MIDIKNLKIQYGAKLALNNINLNLGSYKTHIILGESGSGKSTLLKAIKGLIQPTSGEIKISSPDRIGYVLQDGGLFPHLSNQQNLELLAKNLGWNDQQMKNRSIELTDMMGLDSKLLNRYPLELSGGQRQRFGVARALFLNPSIILFDEPLGALDPVTKNKIQDELKRLLSKMNKTAVWVTHDIGEAAFLSDTVTVLLNGQLVQHGTFHELSKNPIDPYVTELLTSQRMATL